MSGQTVYYHGGPYGLKTGDFILPPEKTRAMSCSDLSLKVKNNPHRKDRVYVTAEMDGAFMFGAQAPWREVAVYAVIPWDELEPDPDCSETGMSFQCGSAKILQSARISNKQRKKILSALGLKFIPFSRMPRFKSRATAAPEAVGGSCR